MFNNISWQGYWIVIAVITTAYYLVIYLLYFRKDFQISFPKRNDGIKTPVASGAVASFLNEQVQPSLFREENEFSTPTSSDESLVYACVDEVNAYFAEEKKRKCAKSEVLYALQRVLAKYPSLNDSTYKESLNNVIRSEAEHHCSLQFSSEEISQVWLER